MSSILLAGKIEMFSLPIGASEPLSCDRVGYILYAVKNDTFSTLIPASK